MKKITVIIAEHNEGSQLDETLDSLYSTSDTSLYDVIVVSDGSEIMPTITGHAKHIHHKARLGVGASFDIGAKMAETPYLITMGSDIRFRDNGYMERMIEHLDNEDKSFICTTNLAINKDKMDVNRDDLMKRYGARLCMFLTRADLPKKSVIMGRLKDEIQRDNYRNILEAKWIPPQDEDIYDIPCILGAFYGVRKSWYDYIKGFQGHRFWGTLEPFISLKSWFAGGKCQIAKDIETAHIFKAKSTHYTRPSDLVYNKLMAAIILFSKDDLTKTFINFLGTNTHVDVAKDLIGLHAKDIERYAREFGEIQEHGVYWFKEKFPFKDYDLL